MNSGSWAPTCGGSITEVDIVWAPNGSHSADYTVQSSDQGTNVCGTVTVWDTDGDSNSDSACVAIPSPPQCTIQETSPPWISGATAVGSTLHMNGGSWQPSCGGGLTAVDIFWWPNSSHSADYTVQSSDQGTSVCGTVTVWDGNGASNSDWACIAIPPPVSCSIQETAPPSVSGGTSVGSTLHMDAGSWSPTCGGGVTAVDVRWWPDGSHSWDYTVQSSDQGTYVCGTVTVWDGNGATNSDSACIPIPNAPPPAAVTVTHTGDGVSIYQNRQGTYYISDACHSSGTSTDSGATIGPGYIYRVDLNGQEVVAPLPSAGPNLNPPTGLGVFMADVYQGDPNDTPWDYTYPDGTQIHNDGNGAFESVQGNVCRGDNNNLGYSAGSGVSSAGSTVTDIGTDTSAPDGGYLWVHYSVDLSDQWGKQFTVLYWYRFYANEVDLSTKVTACPGGCVAGHGGTVPFIKMPKFQYAVSGPAMDYGLVECIDLDGSITIAQQTSFPMGSTTGNHCGANDRNRIDTFNSDSGHQPFMVTARSQASGQFGPGSATFPWVGSGYGLDEWAVLGGSRQHLIYYDWLPSDNDCGANTALHSSDPQMRHWEMSGDDPSVPIPQNHPNWYHPYPYKTLVGLFKGWDDGPGPPDCRSLYDQMVPNETYANFFRLQNGP
jgi:hypothetical protein